MKQNTLQKMWRYRIIYIMLLPIAVYFIVFSYYPLYLGVKASVYESKLIGDANFVGIKNYGSVFQDKRYIQAFQNTVLVGIGTFIFQFLLGLMIAIGLNEIKNKFFKSLIQTTTYLPYILSWSVVGSLWFKLLSAKGLVNSIIAAFSGGFHKPIIFMADPLYARFIMIFTGAWKEAGYYAVLFLAAVVSIDPSIYEAASIDGASRLKQIFFITIPNISGTMKIIIVLGSMKLLRNFDQIWIMAKPTTYDKIRNLLFIIYQDGVVEFKTGYATAAATLVLLLTFIISFVVRKLVKYDETYIS